VKALMTPTRAHGLAIDIATKIWPEAKVYGTDCETKHLQPKLTWNFLTEENQILSPEFTYIPIKGHFMNEGLLYHHDTKSLLGFTDLTFQSQPSNFVPPPYKNWLGDSYFFMLSIYRPESKNKKYFGYYHYSFVTNYKKLKNSIEKLKNYDIEYVSFGHGGQLKGNHAKEELLTGWSWVLDPEKQWTWKDRIFLPPKWMLYSGFWRFLLEQIKPKRK